MESMGGISEREWISLHGAYTTEESDFMASLLNNYSFPPNDLNAGLSLEIPTAYWPAAVDEASYYSSETSDSNVYGISQGNNYIEESTFFPNSAKGNYNLSDSHSLLLANGASLSLDFCMEDHVSHANSYHIEEDNGLNRKMRQSKAQLSLAEAAALTIEKSIESRGKAEVTVDESDREDKNALNEKSKKRCLNSPDVEKMKRSVRARKSQKLASTRNNEEESNVSPNGQSTSSFCSEDESNEQELNGGSNSISKGSATLNSNGKQRASRGSATDPQSLYARKRREKINERLKVLQSLVPNGTKVDISTMLEEAVQYVKFLQLQIKLLSSDDLWMYAPIAYNGMDIGLNLKLMKHDNASQ